MNSGVHILGRGRSTVAMLRRIRAAGFVVAGVSESTDWMLAECEAGGCNLLAALLEPNLMTRTLLQRCDELDIRVVGVLGNQRHRDWAALLPLCETVWLFAPASYYARTLRGYREGTVARFAS